jgi:WD40 repeat protein/transcriptional regulator with XRE-family HTH domain
MSLEQETQDLERIASTADFVRELRALRERAGLTIREVAKAAGTPLSTTGDCFSGKHLPLDREQFARIIGACGETEPERVEAWQEALARLRRAPGRRGGAPYRGLARFDAADERLFFGREDITELLALLAQQPSDLPLMLVGASGAGKSSLLGAGLLPRLRAAAEARAAGSGARVMSYDLTVTGVARLTALLTAAAAGQEPEAAAGAGPQPAASAWGLPAAGSAWGRAAEPPAVIVDQFEAVFTLCPDAEARGALISALCALAERTLVVLALRADFYGEAIRYPRLLRALQERHVVLGPMNAEQVRRAVVEPARQARTEVEDGLVEVILADLAPRAGGAGEGQAHDPGALPLLSHAMLTTWEHGRGATVTVADYRASGGIRDALTKSAERAYESLTPGQRVLARRLLLRLVQLTDDLPPSRASVPLAELREADDTDADQVLSVFVGMRMITVDTGSAQLTHDAVLTAWPRLRDWIEQNAESLRERRRIAEGAKAWAEAGREEAALWRGSQLATARDWASSPDRRAELPQQALEFVDASVAAGTARERLERRRTRRLRSVVAVLTAAVLAVAGLTAYAFSQRQDAVTAERQAVASGREANSRAIAFAADQAAKTDPAAAAQLAAAGYRVAQTPQAAGALLDASDAPAVARIDDSAGVVQWVSVSPDRRLLVAAGADGSLRLWNVAAPGRPVAVATLVAANGARPLYTAAFSPDGSVIAAAGEDRAVHLWRVAAGAADAGAPAPRVTTPRVTALGAALTGPGNTVYSVAFSPDGTLLAAGSADGSVWLWPMAGAVHAAMGHGAMGHGAQLPAPGKPEVNSVAFSADGGVLAAGTSAGTVVLWRVPRSGPAVLYPHMPLTGPGEVVSGVAFSPDGRTLAAASHDRKVWLWTVRDADKKGAAAVPAGTLDGSTSWDNTVAFSPDGTYVAAGTSAASVLVWNLATRAQTADVPQPQPVTGVAWDGTGRIAASVADGTMALITVPSPVLDTANLPANVAYSPDGKTLAVGGASVQLWDTAARTLLATHPLPSGVTVTATSFGSGGVIAVALSDGTVALLNGQTLRPLGAPFPVITGQGEAESVAFSPDGRLIATGADDGSVRLVDVTDPVRPRTVADARDAGTPVYTVAFAADGTTIAAASIDNLVRLWRVSGSSLHLAGKPLGGMASYAIGLAFSPDSKTLAVGSADKTVHLWNVADLARPVALGRPLTGPSGYVWAAAFNPSGTMLAVGVTDGTVWLWHVADPAHPALIATLTTPADHVYGVAFSPSGGQLAATSYEGTVHLWDTSAAAAAAGVCGNLGQSVTAAQWSSYAPGVPYRAPCPAA